MDIPQNYMRYESGHTRGGFNSRVLGDSHSVTMDGYHSGSVWGERNRGWEIANRLINEGEIFSIVSRGGKKYEVKVIPDSFNSPSVWMCWGKDGGFGASGKTPEESIDHYVSQLIFNKEGRKD